jgi:multiple sugar transport system ATP-binding protein
MAEIVLNDVTKRYPDGFEAVKHMNLDIADGEFVILVGPSGCGKSTALRMIAGLEDISEGELRIGGDVVNEKAPKDRDIAMVFQNYALYPHMTVRENMGFALKLAKVPQDEINRKVEEAARLLDLVEHLDRKPANLSGGQRQRVAMGRAIVRDPKAFLMDEPLSNLDAKLRVQTRTVISKLVTQLGTTTVYVTHDQTEALTLGDRVAVMRSGTLQQVAAPGELYGNPINLFVAGFIGSPAMNFLPASITGDRIKLPFGESPVPANARAALASNPPSGQIVAGIRPEDFEDASLVGDKRARGNTFRAKIDVLESLGSESYVYFTVEHEGVAASEDLAELAADVGGDVPSAEAGQVVARIDAASGARQGAELELWYDPEKIHLFEASTGRSLTYRGGDGAAPTAKAPEPAAAAAPSSPAADGGVEAPGGGAPSGDG